MNAIVVLHLIVSVALIVVILLQRPEGGNLGLGGGSNSFLASRGSSNVLTRITMILSFAFFCISLLQAMLLKRSEEPSPILQTLMQQGNASKEQEQGVGTDSSSDEHLAPPFVPLPIPSSSRSSIVTEEQPSAEEESGTEEQPSVEGESGAESLDPATPAGGETLDSAGGSDASAPALSSDSKSSSSQSPFSLDQVKGSTADQHSPELNLQPPVTGSGSGEKVK